ncbi:hypothetical protein LTS08_002003 [Lithohypha guttulata]|uniref:Uncharacterized protein n=1 Tax=Lithohypha guttulata TaxID=1690604 RepID=A0AAN7T7J3_9EURO|nr:hypothetical protein LTR51_004482 [Lithohypha guttulata]KAK5091090.1 hypothetical protein LTR05_001270 [Lithohypha guttulata]KAK5104119.1 hypothetical protein LTS08_002003 [Lithohypha guttulata]
MSVESKLSRLSLDLKTTSTPKGSTTSLSTLPQEAPESWEDEVTDDTPVEAPGPSLKPMTSNDNPGPPPPTPISPQDADPMSRKWESSLNDSGRPTPRSAAANQHSTDRRPEKTTSTANRMISGALGIKAPKKTEEQRQYEKATKEAEIKRKNREKEQREKENINDEKAQAAIWDN